MKSLLTARTSESQASRSLRASRDAFTSVSACAKSTRASGAAHQSIGNRSVGVLCVTSIRSIFDQLARPLDGNHEYDGQTAAVAGSQTAERDRSDVVDDMAIEEALPVCSGSCERRGVHERVEEGRDGVGLLGEARAGVIDEVLQRPVRVASGSDDRLGEPSSWSGERVGSGVT